MTTGTGPLHYELRQFTECPCPRHTPRTPIPAAPASHAPSVQRVEPVIDPSFRLASGNGRTSFIDTRDIADVAALVLASPPEHRGKAYTLTGPQAIGYHEVASRLSASLARPICYEPIGLLRYRRELLAAGSPPDYVRVQLLINIIAKLGLAAKVNNELPRLLHRPSRTLQTYIADHRDLFSR